MIKSSTHFLIRLILCNALGTPVDSKYVQLEPKFVAMTGQHVVTASESGFMLWHYRTPRSQTTLDIGGLSSKRESRDKVYNIHAYVSNGQICSIAARDHVLVFGTRSRHLVGFNLSQPSNLQHVSNVQLPFEPVKMSLNSNST
jgi:WD repeat-containing protein 35